jgi:hypothetical protein
LNLPGAQHGYIEFIDASGAEFFAEGYKQGKTLEGGYRPNGQQLPRDNPLKDHYDGGLSGSDVCKWGARLSGDADTVNDAGIRYHWYGPNSSSVLRYMLNSLPDTSWFNMPWMIGYGSLLPGIEKP